ncbi:MAG TPA: DUF1786 domain-containing protein, partial [Candidatus Methanoperedenaceae archaeon]|nr:DUF1786 domain-containing protein [Candidatus Methanoperedenaceae archaeon]
MRILAIDIGMGTQDILVYDSGTNMENCVKMVMPAQTVIVAGRISKTTREGKDILLYGDVMGGGPCTSAVKKHIAAGLRTYSTPDAALTLHDDIGRVKEMGVEIIGSGEADSIDAVKIRMSDLDMDSISVALGSFDVELPLHFAVAVQDHGFSPHASNRLFRFEHMRRVLERGGGLDLFAYTGDVQGGSVPEYLTRMKAVERTLGNVLLMDTGPAAIRGALLDGAARLPAAVLNVGNGHTMCAAVGENGISGIFEHHTQMMDRQKIEAYIRRLCEGTLTLDEVFSDGGHGC